MELVKPSQSNVLQPDVLAETQESPSQPKKKRTDELEHLTRQTKEFTNLYNLGVAVGSTLELNKVIWRLYKESSRIIDATNFALTLYDADTKTLNFKLLVTQGKPVKPFSINLAKTQAPGLTARTLFKQAPVLIQEVGPNHAVEVAQIYPGQTIRSWLGVPILNPAETKKSALGVIAVWRDTPNALTNHDAWLLSAIATQAAIAIRNAQQFEASQRRATKMAMQHEISQQRATEMALLNNVALTLAATLQLNEVLSRVMESVDGILKTEAGFLFLIDALTNDLVFQIGWGDKVAGTKPFRIPREVDIAGEVATASKPLMMSGVDLKKRQPKLLAPKFGLSIRNLLCVPLISHEQVIGVVEVINKKEGDFSQNDLDLLSSIASYAAIAIENARLHQNVLAKRNEVIEAEELARRDLARDLHDGPTQLISSVLMRLDFCKMLLEREPAKLPQEIDLTQKLADQAIHEIRTLLFEMRPLILEAQGLGEALKIFIERRQKDVAGKTMLTFQIKTPHPNGDISRQDTKVEAAIFAIVQETVNNALKHAQAEQITVQLKETATAIYAITTDNGIGFDLDQVLSNYQQRESFGIVNIHERSQLIGAELTMKSVPGQGTHITVYLPKAKEERLRKRGTGPLSLPLDILKNGNP